MIDGSGVVPSDRPALRRCVAVEPDVFANEYWDARPLLSRAAELPTGFDDLLSLRDVDELLSRRGLRTPFIRLANEGRIVDSKRYTGSGGIGATVRDQVLDERVLSAFADGTTIVLQGLHRLWPPLIEFTEALVADLGHPVQINAYVTPPQSQGFADHYDTHDVFVLALAGRKRWRIRPPVVVRPGPEDPWTDHADEVAEAAAQPALIDTVLEPGDALYLPRGYLHAAAAEGDVCAHLTVGIHPITKRSIAQLLLAQIAQDAELGRALPLRALDDGSALADTVAAVGRRLHDNVMEIASVHDADAVLSALRDELAADTRPEPINPIRQSEAARSLTGADLVRIRRGLRLTIDKGDEATTLDTGVGRIPLAPAEEFAISSLLDAASHRADSLPGLSREDSVDLTVRLLRAGVVVPSTT